MLADEKSHTATFWTTHCHTASEFATESSIWYALWSLLEGYLK